MNQNENLKNKLSDEADQISSISDRVSDLSEMTILEMKIPEAILPRLQKMCNGSDTLIYTVLVSVLKILLFRYSNQNEIEIISPSHKEFNLHNDQNSFVLIKDILNGKMSVKELLYQIQQNLKESYQDHNQWINTFSRPDNLVIFRQAAVLCSFTKIHNPVTINGENIISFNFDVCKDELRATIAFDKHLPVKDMILNLSIHFNYLLNNLNDCLDKELDTLEILTTEEKQKLLYDFNNTTKRYLKDKTVVELFEEQVIRTPNNIALVFGNVKMTYRELNTRANKLGNYLRNQGATFEDVIGIILERSVEMIISVLGIWKAGCAYLPIYTDTPYQRINFILKDAKTKMIISSISIIKTLTLIENIKILDINDKLLLNGAVENLRKPNQSCHLAYIIYTSGTTGNPKGVMVEHRGIYNTIQWRKDEYRFSNNDVILQLFNYVFDGFITSFLTPLVSGSKLLLVDETESKDAGVLVRYIAKYCVTHFISVPAMYSVILENLTALTAKTIKIVTLAGDSLTPELVEKSKNNLPDLELVNEYGPTESSVASTFYRNIQLGENKIIGKPIGNTRVLILNSYNELQPTGVSGEICIAGAGLSRGYLGYPDLTQEKFIASPYEKDELIYKTGDLGRWLFNGTIEFQGRIDDQVKIRGYRIEPAEIESLVVRLKQIKNAVVVAKKTSNDNTALCVYYTSEYPVEDETLRSFLLEYLPEYMMPTHYIYLEKFPLTNNGKIDKKSLPDPIAYSTVTYTKPENRMEEILVDIWQDVLGTDQISTSNNFFKLGGNSINIIQISGKLNSLGYKFPIKDYFKYPTIKTLAEYIQPSSEQGFNEGDIPLTPIQMKFFADTKISHKNYTRSVVLKLNKSLNEEDILQSFIYIQGYHDALRIQFIEENGRFIQRNSGKNQNLFFNTYDLSGIDDVKSEILKRVKDLQSSSDLATNPLLKLTFFKTKKGNFVAIIIHQLIADEKSWDIILDDIKTLFEQRILNQPFKLPVKTSSFIKWSNRLKEYAQEEKAKNSSTVWENLLNEGSSQIKKDCNAGSNFIKDSKCAQFTIDFTKSDLSKIIKAYKTNSREFLLISLVMAVEKTFGINRIKLDIEEHERNEIFENYNAERTIGCLKAIFPVILSAVTSESIDNLIRKNKEIIRKATENCIDYGVLKYLLNKTFLEEDNSQIVFSFLSNPNNVTENNAYEIDSYVHNESCIRPYEIDIKCVDNDNGFDISMTYSYKQYNDLTISALIENYSWCMRQLIEHSNSVEKTMLIPSDFTYKKLTFEQIQKLQECYSIKDIYRLSPMQYGMLYHSLLEEEQLNYFEQISYRVSGDLKSGYLHKALDTLLSRFDTLCSNFLYEGFDEPIQFISDRNKFDVTYYDISNEINEKNKDEVIHSFREKDKERGFNLSKDLLIRVTLLKLAEKEYEFIWSFHHIIMDGWCSEILTGEFLYLYNCFVQNVIPKLDETIPYNKYINWLEKQNVSLARKYWKNYLVGFSEQTVIPGMTKTSESGTNSQQSQSYKLDLELSNELRKLANRMETTLSTVVHAIWGITLMNYNNSNDIVYGTVVSGRNMNFRGIEKIIGLFINTVPLRFNINNDTTFAELLVVTHKTLIENEAHSYISLGDIQSESELKNLLIDHILNYDNYTSRNYLPEADNLGKELNFEPVHIFEKTNYNFNINVFNNERIHIKITYNPNVHDDFFIRRVFRDIETISGQISQNAGIKIEEIKICSDEERKKILTDFNSSFIKETNEVSIVHLIEKQIDSTPDSIAYVQSDTQITYRLFDEYSNYVAQNLKEEGILKGEVVPVILSKAIEMPVIIYALLKSGMAYVPIDHNWPAERKKEILKDLNSKILITNIKSYKEEIQYLNVLFFDKDLPELCNARPDVDILPEDPIYIIYTSGSTGKPKGSINKHVGILNRFQYMNKRYKPVNEDTVLLTINYVFDPSVWQLFWPLMNGLRLVIPDNAVYLTPEEQVNLIGKHLITITGFVPSVFNVLVESINEKSDTLKKIASLRQILIGGEAMSPHHVYKLKSQLENLSVTNDYGPAEASIGTVFYELPGHYIDNIPIGRPIDNVKVLILNKNKNIVPTGVTGELYLGGLCLGLGYLNNPEPTHNSFNKIGLSELNGETYYKTGDLVRFNESGNIEFLGRNDTQLKINGVRIEISEIEQRIIKHHLIKESVVVDYKKNNKVQLLAFYISDEQLDTSEIKQFLRGYLIELMIPNSFIRIQNIPLTTNGKTDKKALYKYIEEQDEEKEKDILPHNALEKNIAVVWENVLNLKKVSIHDNFFDLGGNSIDLIKLHGQLKEKLDKEFNLMKLIQFPTIDSFLKFLSLKDNSLAGRQEGIDRIEKSREKRMKQRQKKGLNTPHQKLS